MGTRGKTWKRHPLSPEAEARRLASARAGLANFHRRWYPTEEEEQTARPPITRERAITFVQFMLAGVPPLRALKHFDPAHFAKCKKKMQAAWLHDWTSSDYYLAAFRTLGGEEWHLLPKNEREARALDKHFAELAWFLYTHSYTDAWDEQLKKINVARIALVERLSTGDSNSTILAALKKLIEGDGKKSSLGKPKVYAPEPTLTDDDDPDAPRH